MFVIALEHAFDDELNALRFVLGAAAADDGDPPSVAQPRLHVERPAAVVTITMPGAVTAIGAFQPSEANTAMRRTFTTSSNVAAATSAHWDSRV